MSGELDAAGNLANAGLVASALEGPEAHKLGDGAVCANCGAALTGRYCAQCGQPAFVHRSLWHLVQEALYSLFNFDTRAWRTLPLLIGRPGTLTRNYIYGKRARYVSPLALFLLSVFFMFFAFSFVHPPAGGGIQGIGDDRADAVHDLAEARTDLANAKREQADATAHPSHDMPAGLQARLSQQQVNIAQGEVTRAEHALARIDAQRPASAAATTTTATTTASTGAATTSAATSSTTPAAPGPATVETTIHGVHIAATNQAAHAPGVAVSTSEPAVAGQTWQDKLSQAARENRLNLNTGSAVLNERIRQKFLNPDLTLYKLEDAAYKYSFLLVPISLPFIGFLFLWKRGLTFYDHTVFALYSLSFASLMFAAVVGLAQSHWTRPLVGWMLGFGLPAHTLFHLKGAYALGWWSAIWRTCFMLFFALICLIIYLVVILVLGLAE